MRGLCLAFLSLLAAPFLMGAGEPRSSRLSGPARFAAGALQQIQQAKPGQEAAFPEAFRGAVANIPQPGVLAAAGSVDEPHLSLLVVVEDRGASLRDAGFDVSVMTGRVAVTRVPLSRLRELETLPGVLRADLALPMKPNLDVSRLETNADEAHGALQPPYPVSGATGKGVVVGIVDSGIDVDHQDFRKADGTTRITHVWDQSDNITSPGPPGEYPCSSNRNYCGTEWFADQINLGQSRQKDFVGHGSHVAGCAAGDGSATGNGVAPFTYVGIAPEADIIFVKTVFFSDAIIEGVDYIQRRAGTKPSVVNLSLGSQFGPHDGTDAFDLAMEDFSGPGSIIVAAAGNEGDLPMHGEAVIPAGQSVVFPLSVGTRATQPGAQNDIIWMEGWYPGDANLSFQVRSPNNQILGPVTPGNDQSSDRSDAAVIVENAVTATVNGDRLAEIILFDNNSTDQAPAQGTWQITVTNNGAQTAEVDIWIALSTLVTTGGAGASVIFTGDVVDFSELVGSPASSDSVIAVGAYTTKRSWRASDGNNYQYSDPGIVLGRIAPFSSPGPRRDGTVKPDLAAPGLGIGAATSAAANPAGDPVSLLPDRQHTMNQGTSQAAPHVAGTVALILQRHPTYARKEVLEALTMTARTDANTGAVPNPQYGYGKLDVNAAAAFVVPVRLLALEAAWEQDGAVVRWRLAETEAGAVFRVERGAAEDGPFAAVSEPLLGGDSFTWVDPAPDAAEPWYRVRVDLRTGGTEYFGPVRLGPSQGRVRLLQNAPNPFRAGTVIAFETERPGSARLEILDVQGRLVTTLVDGAVDPGRHEFGWDGATGTGLDAAAGVYFYRLTTANGVHVRRMVLSR